MIRKFKNLSDDTLIQSTKQEVARDREAIVAVIECLEEIESRRLYSKYGYSTLWEFVVKELGYDSGSAQRRINAMRISRQVPEVKEALGSAALCLSTVSIIEQFTKNEHKQGKKTYSATEKKELLERVAHKSTRETEFILRAISPDALLPKERQRPVNDKLIEVSFLADKETIALLNEAKRLMSGSSPNPSTADALKHALKLAVAEKSKKIRPMPDSLAKAVAIKPDPLAKAVAIKPDPLAKAVAVKSDALAKTPALGVADPQSSNSRAGVTGQASSSMTGRKYISIHKRRAVYQKSGGQCTFVSPITSRRCESRHQLELEHIQPVARAGSDELKNLTLLCKSHNLYNAVQEFGGLVARSRRG